jgi:signal transduction histidine kinase
MRLRGILRSYSFRSAALVFLAFSMTLVAIRMSVYAQSLHTAYGDIRLVIDAHAEELNENLERYGLAYTSGVVDAVIADAADDKLFIALRSARGVVGNFPRLPEKLLAQPGWGEVYLDALGQGAPKHLYVHSLGYPDGATLLVGYDLGKVDAIRQALPEKLFENVELSLLLTLVVSLLLVWLLNRHVRKFNTAFEQVRQGNIGYRMSVRSDSDQFDRLAMNLNRMLDWLATMLATSRDLSNSLAHDLRTPLSRHRLELRCLSEQPTLPAELKQRLDASVEQLDELVDMFNNILTIAEAESRESIELFENLDLTELVKKILEYCLPMADEKPLTIEAKLPATPVSIAGDRQLLGQAILNLLDNAIKYTPGGGAVQLELRRGKSGVTLVVADNGAGVAEDMLGKVTQRFFRADSARKTPGNGLGLSLVAAVAKLHHGSLLLENTHPGFRVTLRLGLEATG